MNLELPMVLGLIFIVISLILVREKIIGGMKNFVARFRHQNEQLINHRTSNPATVIASEDAEMKCDICFDLIGNESVSKCPCGKIFHRSCAEPTGFCPYCNRKFSEFDSE